MMIHSQQHTHLRAYNPNNLINKLSGTIPYVANVQPVAFSSAIKCVRYYCARTDMLPKSALLCCNRRRITENVILCKEKVMEIDFIL